MDLATNFNGQLPIGYLPLQPSSGSSNRPVTNFEPASSNAPPSTKRIDITESTTSSTTSKPKQRSTTTRSTTATTTASPVIQPKTTRRKIITTTVTKKKTTPITTTKRSPIIEKKFTPKTPVPTTVRTTASRPTYHSYRVKYPQTVALQGVLKDPYSGEIKGNQQNPSYNGKAILAGFKPIYQKPKSTKAHSIHQQIPSTRVPLITTTPTTSIQNRYPTYKPQPDLVVAHTTISSTTTPLYDPFQFQIKESKSGKNRGSSDKTKINQSKKLAFLKGVEKLRTGTTKNLDHKSFMDEGGEKFHRQRRTTSKPLFGVTVTPRSFPKRRQQYDDTLPKRRRFEESNSHSKTKTSSQNSSIRKHKQELARVPKSASSLVDKTDKNQIAISSDARRNMLMNIILRPGGGDKSKALPRPKVDVYSEGANVIVVRMTFPENENIQGLRAYTPDPESDLEKLADIERILPENASIERISAISSEENGKGNSINGIPEDVVQSISNTITQNNGDRFAQLNEREKLTENPIPHTFRAPSTSEFEVYDFEEITDDNGGSAQEQYDEPFYYDLTSDNALSNQHIRRQRQPQEVNIERFHPIEAKKDSVNAPKYLRKNNKLPVGSTKSKAPSIRNKAQSIPPPPKPPTRPTRPPKKIPKVSFPSAVSSKTSPALQYVENSQAYENSNSYQPYLSTLTPTSHSVSKWEKQRYAVRGNTAPKKWVSPYTRISTHGNKNAYQYGSKNTDATKYFPQSRKDGIPTTVTSWPSRVKTTPLRGLLQKFFPFSSERLS